MKYVYPMIILVRCNYTWYLQSHVLLSTLYFQRGVANSEMSKRKIENTFQPKIMVCLINRLKINSPFAFFTIVIT